MRRSESSAAHESRTLPMQGMEATERLADARLVLGRYRLERQLGAGGFGVVWLAWDQKLEREVAVKAIPIEEGGGDRAEREARAAARLNHPGIVAVYELAADEHEVYLVSELVRGRTLAELVHAGAVADRDVARIGAVLCDALEHAHARGVIHRDVKPQNVMVVADPAVGAGFAKLADFGVAHLASGDPLTRTGDVVGTLAYMAPEQAEGAGVTPACDVYSLALTLYEAWTGSNPVRAGGLAATARRLGQPLPPLAGRRRDLPRGLCDLVDDALAIDPAERPSPAELRVGLAEAERELDEEGGLEEPATLRRVGLPAARRPRRFGRRGAPVLDVRDAAALAELAEDLRADPTNGLGVLGRRRRPLGQPASIAGAGGLARSGRYRRRGDGLGRPRQPRIRRALVPSHTRRGGGRGHCAAPAGGVGRLRPGAVRVAGHRGRPAGHRAAPGCRARGGPPVPPARRPPLVGARGGAAPGDDRPGAGLRGPGGARPDPLAPSGPRRRGRRMADGGRGADRAHVPLRDSRRGAAALRLRGLGHHRASDVVGQIADLAR